MILFYLFAMMAIFLKVVEFCLLSTRQFFNKTVLDIHLIGLIAALIVGIVHSYNLMKLISDLKMIAASANSDYRAV